MKELILDNWAGIMEKFHWYFDGSSYFILFLLAVLFNFLVIKKEDKNIRAIVCWLPVVVGLILFNPIVHKFLDKYIGENQGEDYWRCFWILPLAPCMAYGVVRVIKTREKSVERILVGIALAIIIAFSGKMVYNSTNYSKVNNWYKMPDDILNAIMIIHGQETENKKVMFPIEISPWVRQYDGTIKMEYGRSTVEIYAQYVNDFQVGNIKKYMKKYQDDNCNFIILNRYVQYDANIEDYGFKKVGENATYIVYMLNESK